MPRKAEPVTDFVSTLQQLADLTEIRGPSGTAIDLRRSVAVIAALDSAEQNKLLRRARRDTFDEPGISPTLHWKLREIALGGADVALRAARAGVPWLIRRLLELPAVTTEQAALLVRQLGIVTLTDLEVALDDGRVAQILPAGATDRLVSAAFTLQVEAAELPLGRALALIDSLLADVSKAGAGIVDVVPAGDVRRFETLVRDFVVVAATTDPQAAIDAVCVMPALADVLHRSGRRAVLHYQHVEFDLRVGTQEDYGTMLFNATGSRDHIKAVTARRGRPAIWAREEDVYRQVGLPWIPAEIRHATGEIEAAAEGALPALVERRDIRGDLHMHSTYSDGRDALTHMVAACCALGYEYMAITDHSERAAASRTLSADELARQGDEVARLREEFPQITILHGAEVDILLDGSLDFPDAVLEGLDIVLASMHESGRQDPRALTRRCIQAIRHPLVNVITHPANRLVGRQAGYALEFDAIYAAAAETGTALEIDGAPSHLDLDSEHARAAVAAGVTIAIDSDCHQARALDRQMEMGIGIARRGWVEARHVLNARPVAEVRAFVAAKRR